MRVLVVIVLMLAHALAQAQEMKLPLWMLQSFSGGSTVATDSVFDARMYAGFGVDSLRSNRFIGTYKGSIRLVEKDQRVDFSGWADSTKATMAMILTGQGKQTTITYLADLRTNTAIMAASDDRGKAANVTPLCEILLLNPMMRGASERNEVKSTTRTRKVMGITCTERYRLEGIDTLWVYASNIARSPFVDTWNWMPMGGENFFMAFGLLGSFGDPMPLLLSTEDLVIELTEVKQGPQPPPTFDLSTYPLTDKRKRDWSHAVSSAAPTLRDALKPLSTRTGTEPVNSGSRERGSNGAVGTYDVPASGMNQVIPGTVLPSWLEVQSIPKRRLLRIPTAPPIDAVEEEVLIMFTGNADGSIDLEHTQVLVPEGEGIKQPPFSPGELLALRLLSDFVFEPIQGISGGTIRFRFGAK